MKDEWVGMACTGSFTGGGLCLLDLDLKIRFLIGDSVFFRSCVLQHFVRCTIGERSSTVFFSHSCPTTITQNIGDMSPGDPRFQSALKEKALRVASVKDMEDKRKAYAHLPPYPTVDTDLMEHNLEQAGQRKEMIPEICFGRIGEGRH